MKFSPRNMAILRFELFHHFAKKKGSFVAFFGSALCGDSSSANCHGISVLSRIQYQIPPPPFSRAILSALRAHPLSLLSLQSGAFILFVSEICWSTSLNLDSVELDRWDKALPGSCQVVSDSLRGHLRDTGHLFHVGGSS